MASKTAVGKFRQILRRSLFLSRTEGQLFDQLPESIVEAIFRHNFNGNLAMAERVLFNRYKDVDQVDRARLEQEKKNIHNMARAARDLARDLAAGRDVLFITDNDNDGSLAQAVLIEFTKALDPDLRRHVHIEYAQPIGESRGFNVELVDLATQARGWPVDHPFTLITADNGINSRDEQAKIQQRYPRSTLVVTDHHLPDERTVVLEDDRSMIVNPKYKPTDYFKSKNISGANTLGVLLGQAVGELLARQVGPDGAGVEPTADQRQALANMVEIGSWANLLDYANADMADMPVRPYVIEKALDLRPLLNVSNSMSNLITGRFSQQDVADVLAASKGIKQEWLHEKLEDISTLNTMARKLLGLYHRHQEDSHTFTEKGFYEELSQEMMDPELYYSSINPNYIEQLRPIIFNLAAIDNKDLFMTLTADTMVGVYEELRKIEKDILKGLREVGLLRQDKRGNSTILYPVDDSITKIFNRRLLGKAYNQDNNGFVLMLSSFSGQEVKGSMRSLYDIGDILEGQAAIEAKLGVELEFQGHDRAAGFFVRSTNGQDITEEKLGQLNAWIDDRITQIKVAERVNQMPNLEVDFASVSLVTKINSAAKANLAGMWGLPTVMRFSPNKGDQVWVTDPETTEQVNLAQVVARKSFGYQAIATDFGGGAMVVPVELLRSIVDSGYTKGLRLDYMDEGVFMGTQVVQVDAMPNLVPFKGGREEQEALVGYYQESFKDSNFTPISRQDFRDSPYFRYNRFGQQEFERWESLMIHVLDKTGRDVLAVVDTEGTGLGKAPKCFNIGGTNIAIDPTSGKILDAAEFEARYFRDEAGREYLLGADQMGALIALDEDEDPEVEEGQVVILHKMSLDTGVALGQRFACPGSRADLEAVTNLKVEDGEVIYNRTVSGFAFSFLIKDKDFAITKEFEDLTGIGNWMVEKLGKSAAAVDKALVSHYSKLKDMHGNPAKIIFQAHNMPYDKGVIAANFQKLNSMMDDHITSDTAKLARQAKLAYDDTPVSSFDDVEGVPAKAYFYDSPYSDYSLSTFLERCSQGKGGVFPDTTAKILLRYSPSTEQFSIIDRKENREVEIPATLEKLLERKQVGQMPNNAVRYSVERMSSRAMIRNIILLDKPKPARVELQEHELPVKAALEAFQDNYHFDATPEVNIDHFKSSLLLNDPQQEGEIWGLDLDLVLMDLVGRFLHANRELQAKFHDGWIYEKVLAHFEPTGKARVAEDVIEQINYYTDLPSNKIRKVLDDVVRFKEHFGIDHALVHEQHNNIRQHSEDGQGLSDTAYESVLPGMLAMTKFYNPYFQSTLVAAERMIDANIKGSLIQNMLGDDYNNELARDSYSVRQMLAFSRKSNTDVVRQAQALAAGPDMPKPSVGSDGDPVAAEAEVDVEHPVVKFKLSGELLPPGSAIYGKPKRHLSQEEVAQLSQDLTFVIVNEQIKSSVKLSRGLGTEHCKRLMDIAAANDAKACRLRDKILEVFDTVEYSRKDAELKKVSDMMKDVFSGIPASLPRGFKATQEQADTARAMLDSFRSIFQKMGVAVDCEEPETLVALLDGNVQRQLELAQIQAQKVGADAKPEQEDDKQDGYFNPVPCARFLPEVDIVRREPMKFVLKHHGADMFYKALRALPAPEPTPGQAPVRQRAPAP